MLARDRHPSHRRAPRRRERRLGGVLIIYLIVLGLAAALGAVGARRTPPAWPRSPQVAVVLATALLAIPVVSVVLAIRN